MMPWPNSRPAPPADPRAVEKDARRMARVGGPREAPPGVDKRLWLDWYDKEKRGTCL